MWPYYRYVISIKRFAVIMYSSLIIRNEMIAAYVIAASQSTSHPVWIWIVITISVVAVTVTITIIVIYVLRKR